MDESIPEDPRNVFITCSEHASRPQEKYALEPASNFLNKWVKACFEEIGTEKKEHLWIKVLTVKDDKTLIGIIDNDPFLNLQVKFGDTVEVKLYEIEDVTS
jgi:uncharacterized protein YegJ (DUF2314 family)